jgi:hypothetical protein
MGFAAFSREPRASAAAVLRARLPALPRGSRLNADSYKCDAYSRVNESPGSGICTSGNPAARKLSANA